MFNVASLAKPEHLASKEENIYLSLPKMIQLSSLKVPDGCSVSADLLRLFFEALYDEDVVGEDTFYKWKSSKDPAELRGKVVALRSVMAFYTWLIDLRDSYPALIFDEMTLV